MPDHPDGRAGEDRTAAPVALAGLLGAAAGSAGIWAFLSFRFHGENGAAPVAIFLWAILALFVILGAGFASARRLAAERPQLALVLILGTAALFRLLLLPAGLAASRGAAADDLAGRAVGFERFLLYDQDVWRYLWDGHLVARGIDPYGRTPEEWERLTEAGDPRAEAILEEPPWLDAFDMIAFRGHRSVYPPLAQAAFGLSALVAPGSVLVWKLLLLVVDLGTCGLLAALLARLGRGRWEVILYAWNPLVLKEVAGSGHVDALAALGLAGAALALVAADRSSHPKERRRGESLTLAALAFAGLAKLTPLVAAPAFLARIPRRRGWILPAALAVGSLPFAAGLPDLLHGLSAMAAEWRFQAGGWDLFAALGEWIVPGAGRGVATAFALLATLALGVWILRDRSALGALRAAYAMLLAFLLLGPAVMPWYAVGLLPLAVAVRGRAGLAFSALGFLSYLVYVDGTEGIAARAFVHAATWALLAIDLRRIEG